MNPKCFGTKEYSKNCGICITCYEYIECGKIKNKKPKLSKSKNGRKKLNYFYLNLEKKNDNI